MAKRCSRKYGCKRPRATWWRDALGVNWLSSTQGVPAGLTVDTTLYTVDSILITADNG